MEIELVGRAAWLRNALFGIGALLSVIAAVGYVLPAHDLRGESDVHSNFADGGPFPIIVLLGLAIAFVALRRRSFGAGIGAGILSSCAAVGAVIPVFLAHFLADTRELYGEHLFAGAVIGLFFLGPVFVIAEIVLYVMARRRLRRPTPPSVPSAHLVR